MKKVFAGVLILTSFPAAASTPEDLLRGVWNDPRLRLHNEALGLAIEAKSYNPLDKADLRIDGGQWTENDVKYAVRLYPKGYTEHRTTIEFQKAMEKNEKAAQKATLSQLLASRYELLARLALLKEKKSITSDMMALSRKASKALSYTAQTDRAEIKSYLRNKADIDKINIQIADTDRDYDRLQAELQELSLDTAEKFDLSDFASVEDLSRRLEALAGEAPKTKTLSAHTAELELLKSRAGISYDRAKDEKWFDFVEVSVSEVQQQRVYGFKFGFNLPFASAPNLSRVDKEIRDLRDKVKLVETVETADKTFKTVLVELQTLLAVHKTLSLTQARMKPEQMRKASQTIATQDPMLAVELQKGWFESREQILDLEYRIRSLFILYLYESSVFVETPEQNYFSKSLKRIL